MQLDSLADDITFGLAPSLVLYDIYIHATSYYDLSVAVMEPLRFVVLIVAAFSVLRLAKFNIDDTQATEFSGLPTPANALLIMSLAVLVEQGRVVLYQEHILLIAIATALLLISPIRMFSLKFKGLGIKCNELRYGFLAVSLAMIIFMPAYSIVTIIVLYIVLSTLRWMFIR